MSDGRGYGKQQHKHRRGVGSSSSPVRHWATPSVVEVGEDAVGRRHVSCTCGWRGTFAELLRDATCPGCRFDDGLST